MTPSEGHPERDSLLLVTTLVPEGEASAVRFRVRNLSSGGMLIQGEHPLAVGTRVSATLRNLGTVMGKVAWAREGRYGISFDTEIDPQAVRAPVALADYLSDSIRLRPRS